MTDKKLISLAAFSSPGASNLFYTCDSTGSVEGKIDYTTMAPVFAGLLVDTFSALGHVHAAETITGLAQVALTNDYDDLDNLPSLFSGAYADLSGKPTLGTLAALSTVAEADQTLADNTTNNVSITKHGYAPKAPNDATKYLDGTGAYSVPAGSGGVSDGDKGDITVSASGATWTIDNAAVTLAKIANASANSKLLGSGAAGSGAAYAELSLGSGVQMSSTTLKGADYFSILVFAASTSGSDTSVASTTSYTLSANLKFGLDLDYFNPTHFLIELTNGAPSAGTITAQLCLGSSATTAQHTGGDDLAMSGAGADRSSGWRTFDNPGALTGFQTFGIAIKASAGTPSLTFRAMRVHFRR